jgi:hypothetical protein
MDDLPPANPSLLVALRGSPEYDTMARMSISQLSSLSLWLGKPVLDLHGSPTQELVFDDIYEQVDHGKSLNDAIAKVTATNARAGDFGIEIAGSMMAVLLAEGLKAFWSAYIGELEKKLATKAANLTFDRVVNAFKLQAHGPDRDDLIKSVSVGIAEAGAKLNLPQSDVEALTKETSTVILERLPH